MPEELLRRGDLVLVRSSTSPRAGLYRGEGDELGPAGALDRAEWRWTIVCAGPLALQVLGPDPGEVLRPTGPIADPPQAPCRYARSHVPSIPRREPFMRREIIEPTRNECGDEQHPAWGLIAAHRVRTGPVGATLFDSDIRHQHTVTVSISTAARRRDLHRDWLHAERAFVEVEMSEAQWASFVSSMNAGSGVPCTIRRREEKYSVPGMPFEPRLAESMDEVHRAAGDAAAKVAEAFAAYREKKTAANLRTLEFAIQNMPANIRFAAESLSEHAENVVQRARADIEAMVVSKAQQLGLEPGDLAGEIAALTEGGES